MNTTKLICGAALLTLAASCAQDEMELDKIANAGKPTPISYKVDTDKMSRATSAYENGTDVNTINVSAWIIAPKTDKDDDGNNYFILDEKGEYTFALPSYDQANIGNADYFTNDVLTRQAGAGTFNYETDARYWPNNNEILDFYALVDNWDYANQKGLGEFSFRANGEDFPGVDATIKQGGLDELPDMLYAVAFNQKAGNKVNQKNVSFLFNHAFAQVIVSAEVKNKNLHVVITDMEIHGILDEGQFFMPYKSGSGPETIENPAWWHVDANKLNTDIKGLMKNNGKKEVVLDKTGGHKTKDYLVGGEGGKENQLLVLPYNYNGRNGSKCQTYIQLKCYAYNKSGATLDDDTDALIYGNFEVDGDGNRKPVPMIINIPIEFNWVMGTKNTYNITFDCGNGGETDPSDNPGNPNKPAFMRIGYEVEVRDWVDVNHGDYEYPDNVKH